MDSLKIIMSAIIGLFATAIIGFWSMNGQLSAVTEAIKRIDYSMTTFDTRLTYVERRTTMVPYGTRKETEQ